MGHNRKKYLIILVFFFTLNSSIILAKPLTKLKPPELFLKYTPGSGVTMMWSVVPDEWRYEIYRAKAADSVYVKIASVYSSSFTDPGENTSPSYWYYVRAYNLQGKYVDSNHVNILIPGYRKVLGFATYDYTGDNKSYNSLVNNSYLMDQIATYTYTTDSAGNITGNVQRGLLNYAAGKDIETLALVTNDFSPDTAKILLESPANRQRLIGNILYALKNNNYRGVNIDIEGIYYYDRDYYTAFIQELYNTLKPAGYIVTIDVPAKTWDNPLDGWSGGYDYKKLANMADQIIIMTYDEHYSGGTPGPIASIGWVQKVIEYALAMIPPQKIMLGVASYGYDWSIGGTKAYGMDQAVNTAAKYGSTILWDEVSKSPHFKYVDSGVTHTVWFENDASLGYKLDLVNKYNLSGIAMWKLGFENKSWWNTVKSRLKQQ